MDVQLLVYDLSHGLARQLSMGMLGFQLDAVYHTSILLGGLEYVYQQTIRIVQPGEFPGFGLPIERVHLGQTQLPNDVIMDFINSVRDRYTPEAYNLFTHNCNNFSNEFATFLTGNGIPGHIVNMPQAVLGTPFGAMLQNQMAGMFPSGDAAPSLPPAAAPQDSQSMVQSALNLQPSTGVVKNVSNLGELDGFLSSASSSFAVVFFTSATCPPCKMLYPMYDELAQEVGDKGYLIKADVSQPVDVGRKYSIRATPTFITFLKGAEDQRWSGADGAKLRSTVQLLVQMAHPPHPHSTLRLPTFYNQTTRPVTYEKVPPLDKLLAKMGDTAADPAVQGAKVLIESKSATSAESIDATMASFAAFLQKATKELPREIVFTVVDLLRCSLIDSRVGDFFIYKEPGTLATVFSLVNSGDDCPYALRLVTLHMACNIAKSTGYSSRVIGDPSLRRHTIQLITTSLLDETHSNIRVSAATLLLNVVQANSKLRRDGQSDILPEDDQVELAASVVEAISREDASADALKGLLLALGFLVYLMPLEGEMADLLTALDAQAVVLAKKEKFSSEPLVGEVGELLGKCSSK